MVRASSAANAPFYDRGGDAGTARLRAVSRQRGGAAANLATASGAVPAYLKVERVGTTYTAYTSSDGVTWTRSRGSSAGHEQPERERSRWGWPSPRTAPGRSRAAIFDQISAASPSRPAPSRSPRWPTAEGHDQLPDPDRLQRRQPADQPHLLG